MKRVARLIWKLATQRWTAHRHGYPWTVMVGAALVMVACGGGASEEPPVVADAHMGYVWGATKLEVFFVDSAGHATQPKRSDLVVSDGFSVVSIELHPNRRFAYVAASDGRTSPWRSEVQGFSYDTSSGALIRMPSGSIVHSGLAAPPGEVRHVIDLLMHPTGKFLHVVMDAYPESLTGDSALYYGQLVVLRFGIDPSTGALSQMGEQYISGYGARFDVGGNFLFTASGSLGDSGAIYKVNAATGALSGGQSFNVVSPVAQPSGPWIVAVEAFGAPVLLFYAVDANTGEVVVKARRTLLLADGTPLGADRVQFSPDGKQLYVSHGAGIWRFEFDQDLLEVRPAMEEPYPAAASFECFVSRGNLLLTGQVRYEGGKSSFAMDIASIRSDDGLLTNVSEVSFDLQPRNGRCGLR